MSIPTRCSMRFALLALALLAAACSGTTSTTITDSAASDRAAQTSAQEQRAPTAAPEPTAQPEPTATPEPTPAPEPTPTPEPADAVFWGSELSPGTCFNRLPNNPPFQPPDIISCDDFHAEEIYGAGQFDAPTSAPYPGSDVLVEQIAADLCDAATVDFGGETWDQVPFEAFILYPTEVEWEAGDRNIFCSAAPTEDVAFKIGTAAGGTIDSDDVLIARARLTSDGEVFDDWIVITEGATVDSLGSLTDGQFDLPLRRPSLTAQGFVFAADEGSDGFADSIWGYDWQAGTVSDLGGFEDGSEFGTVLFAADKKVVLTARTSPDSDWDLWMATDGSGFLPFVAGPGDQRFPTLTPDGTHVVYQDSGDLWIIDTSGGEARQLTSGPDNDYESTVSPDGSTVVFASDRSGNDDLWSVSIEGGEPVNLTDHPGDDIWPIFSTDGKLIYFSSDRLDPVDDRSKVMVMNADGSNQSWFAITNSAQALLVPTEVAAEVVMSAPTLDERYNYELIADEAGTTAGWAHSSGRLIAELPAGWRVAELTDQIGFLAAARPSAYFDTWVTDGVMVRLFDGETPDSFFDLVAEADAIVSCDQFDGTDGVEELSPGFLGLAANHDCGEGSVGGVLAFYNTETGVGVVLEGQTDGLPSRNEDNTMITAIAETLSWQ